MIIDIIFFIPVFVFFIESLAEIVVKNNSQNHIYFDIICHIIWLL